MTVAIHQNKDNYFENALPCHLDLDNCKGERSGNFHTGAIDFFHHGNQASTFLTGQVGEMTRTIFLSNYIYLFFQDIVLACCFLLLGSPFFSLSSLPFILFPSSLILPITFSLPKEHRPPFWSQKIPLRSNHPNGRIRNSGLFLPFPHPRPHL